MEKDMQSFTRRQTYIWAAVAITVIAILLYLMFSVKPTLNVMNAPPENQPSTEPGV